ncbi:hypothetical protein PGTUg99_018622 [Puccinia graminis f. sp. tritici]|uniref:Uncharacterized protein n=1 Tax=Puccinia graminis f. sp. tritici TaxID=56615 RepID=A0A5B0R7Z2_PUCGR|nr:hypothetical protein PGTUg99_018622 [Puccinia graminis f. sp. tritici]
MTPSFQRVGVPREANLSGNSINNQPHSEYKTIYGDHRTQPGEGDKSDAMSGN